MGGRHAANRRASDSGQHGEQPFPDASRGADEAFEALVGQHRANLFAYVLGLTGGDRALTTDIVKETLYRAAQEPTRLRRRGASVRAWLVVLAGAVFAEQQQDAASAQAPGRLDPAAVPGRLDPAAVPGPAASTTILRAMDNLSQVHRDILVELFYAGTSLQEAAAERGVPVETVKSRLYYAMRALRLVLDQQTP